MCFRASGKDLGGLKKYQENELQLGEEIERTEAGKGEFGDMQAGNASGSSGMEGRKAGIKGDHWGKLILDNCLFYVQEGQLEGINTTRKNDAEKGWANTPS